LLIQTEYAGAVPIDWKQVKTLESDQELLVKQDAYTGEKAKSLTPPRTARSLWPMARRPRPSSWPVSSRSQTQAGGRRLVWKGNIDLALDYSVRKRHRRLRHRLQDHCAPWSLAAHRRRRIQPRVQDDVVTTNNWRAEYALDRFITDKWFWQGRLVYKRDKVEDLSRQRTVGTGPGYQFWDDELGAFSLGSLVNRTDYEYRDGGKDNFYSWP
jgi:hypothetical protein